MARCRARGGGPLDAPIAKHTFATVHPASVLRAPDDEARQIAREAFFADLAAVGDAYRMLAP